MANNNNFYKFHIFSPGNHTSASGHGVSITKEDLEKTAQIFKSNFRVPMILGHSTHARPDVMPALGWLKDVKLDEDGKLYALVESTKAGSSLIEGNYLNNVSASFYSPDSPLNPSPNHWTLRHLACLGAEVPSLKDLDPLLEIIPENFSEVKNSSNWISFSEEDRNSSLLFNGTGTVLPDNYEFKTFTKYGSSFRNKHIATPKCTAGNKLCNGKCIKQSWTCRDENKAITSVGIPNAAISPAKPSYNNGTVSSTPRPLYDKVSATKTEGSYVKTNSNGAIYKPYDKEAAKDKQTKDNLTTGNLKALGALALTLGAEYGSDKVFPSNKQGQLAVKLLANVASDQLLLKNEATSSQRLQTAFFSGVSKGTELGLTEAFKDNPYASTHAKATSGLLGVILVDSGVLDLPFDGYAKKMFYASSTMASAIKETKQYNNDDKNKFATINDVEKTAKEEVSKLDKSINENKQYATIEDMERVSKENIAQLLKKINSANSSSAKAAKDIKGQKQMLEWLMEVMERGSYDDCQNKLKEISKAYERVGKVDLSEITYEHTNVPITFTTSEIYALMQPMALMVLKSMGVIDAALIEEKKSKAKTVKTSTPELDAIFSEMKIIKPEITNGKLHDALFNRSAIIKVSNSSDFKEQSPQGRTRKHLPINNGTEDKKDDFSEQESVATAYRKKKLKIDILLDDALSQTINNYNYHEPKSPRQKVIVSNFKEQTNVPVKKSGKRFQSLAREEKIPTPVPVAIDFKETDEYKSLINELTQAKHTKRILEIENFTESLYKEGKLTEGIAKKKELTALLLSLDTGAKNLDFGENIKVENPYSFMEKLLHNIEPIVSFSEIVSGSVPDILFQPKFETGFNVESQKLDFEISKLMGQNPTMSYSDALKKLA